MTLFLIVFSFLKSTRATSYWRWLLCFFAKTCALFCSLSPLYAPQLRRVAGSDTHRRANQTPIPNFRLSPATPPPHPCRDEHGVLCGRTQIFRRQRGGQRLWRYAGQVARKYGFFLHTLTGHGEGKFLYSTADWRPVRRRQTGTPVSSKERTYRRLFSPLSIAFARLAVQSALLFDWTVL